MDLYEYLKKDHDKIDELFSQFEKTDIVKYQKEIIEMLLFELNLHSISEQETFYKMLLNFEETKENVQHGKKEHKEIQDLSEKISKIQKVDAAWRNNILKLKDLVNHHVKEEESDIFKKAKKVLSKEEEFIIKEKMHNYKLKMKTNKIK